MSTIEQAAKRLEALRRAGVAVPWHAAGLSGSEIENRIERTAGASLGEVAAQPDRAAPPPPPPRRSMPSASPVPEVSAESAPASRPVREPECITLDIAALQLAGHVVPADARSRLAEEFRHVKRPLLRNMRGAAPEDRMSLMMITSALPGEGKTFCSINLALSMALEIDTSVLLVDADVVRPDVLGRLGVSPRRGLLDMLTDDSVELSDVVLSTSVPKLSLLPAGTPNSRSTELLASDAMNRLLNDLALRHHDRIVIFDAPPLLVTTEAKVLASRVGQVVVVVEACSTPRSAVEQAIVALEQCPTVMTLLNKRNETTRRYGYADYYG